MFWQPKHEDQSELKRVVSWGGGSVFWQPKHADQSELKRVVSWGGGSVFWQPKHADQSELKRAVSWRTEHILATKIRCINEWKIIKNCVPQCHNEHKQYLHPKTLSPRSFSTHGISGLPRDASTFLYTPQAAPTVVTASLGCPETLLLSLRPHRPSSESTQQPVDTVKHGPPVRFHPTSQNLWLNE
jgi:hypothetical protein